jgi:Ni2+-binding GTPase involved in maturation of urease and hydrogenase
VIPSIRSRFGILLHVALHELDAAPLQVLAEFPPGDIDVLVTENVGNPVCPAQFKVGEDVRVMVYAISPKVRRSPSSTP